MRIWLHSCVSFPAPSVPLSQKPPAEHLADVWQLVCTDSRLAASTWGVPVTYTERTSWFLSFPNVRISSYNLTPYLLIRINYSIYCTVQNNEVFTVDTWNWPVGGEYGVEYAIRPVILVLEKENILDKGWWANITKWTVQTGLHERSPLLLQGPFAPEVTLKQQTH